MNSGLKRHLTGKPNRWAIFLKKYSDWSAVEKVYPRTSIWSIVLSLPWTNPRRVFVFRLSNIPRCYWLYHCREPTWRLNDLRWNRCWRCIIKFKKKKALTILIEHVLHLLRVYNCILTTSRPNLRIELSICVNPSSYGYQNIRCTSIHLNWD